jgi:outer membrane protein assembly factor BamB
MPALRHGVALALAVLLLSASVAHAWRADGLAAVIAIAVDGADDAIVVGQTETEFAVIKYDGASGAELWRRELTGTAGGNDNLAVAVAVDAADNLYVTGRLENTGTFLDFAVMKLAGATGAEIWRVELDGAGSADDFAGRVSVIGSDVVAVATLFNTDYQATVVRLAGATGAELWRYELSAGTSSGAGTVHVDGNGDVLVGVSLTNMATEDDIGIVKLAGATGAELWLYQLSGPEAAFDDRLGDTAIDASGDVFLNGTVEQPFSIVELVRVVKVDGATGAELWRTDPEGGACTPVIEDDGDVIVDAGGNPIISAALDDSRGGCQGTWSVLKFDGATGTQLWWHEVVDDSNEYNDKGEIAVDTTGAVLAAGTTKKANFSTIDKTVVKLDGATGAEQWRQAVTPMFTNFMFLVLDSQDNPIAGRDDVFKLSGLSGAVGPVGGRRLGVRDVAGQPGRRSLRTLSNDASIAVAPPGSAGDPRVSGAVLTLLNPTTLESASLPLPAAGWQGLGSPSGARGYRYVDGAGTYGPCNRVTLKPKLLSARCSGRNAPFPFTLDEPSQGSLTVSLTIGDPVESQCVTFGGDVRKDVGTANPGPAGSFSALDAPFTSGSCP